MLPVVLDVMSRTSQRTKVSEQSTIHCPTLKVGSPKRSNLCQPPHHHIPEHNIQHSHRRHNIKSNNFNTSKVPKLSPIHLRCLFTP